MANGPENFDFQKLFSKENLPKTLGVAGGIVAFVVLIKIVTSNVAYQPEQPGAPALNRIANGGATPVQGDAPTGSGPVPLSPLTSQFCQTYAPEGWTVTDAGPDGNTFVAQSPDGTMTAAYGGVAVYTYTTPERVVQGVVNAAAGDQMQMASNGSFGTYQVVSLQGAARSGYALYLQFPTGVPNSFGVITRVAVGPSGDQHAMQIAGSVAAAIRCQSQLHPPPASADRGSSHGTGTSSSCSGGGNCDDSDLAGTYNAQLGTGWAHDSLGRNYNVDVTSDYNANGPDGPGYYASVGGRQEKLQGGLQ